MLGQPRDCSASTWMIGAVHLTFPVRVRCELIRNLDKGHRLSLIASCEYEKAANGVCDAWKSAAVVRAVGIRPASG